MPTTISVTPGYIGQKTSADKSNILSYSITTDGTMSDITEKINGVTIATRTNPTSGQQFTVSLTQEQWDAIQYGNAHTLTIEMGSDTWTYTFDKRLNANDDILSAVKGVQDLQTHLNAIKAQLAAAIRSKGGTVNDTDSFSAFVSAVSNMTNKKWASGAGTTGSSPTTFLYADGTNTSSSYFQMTGLDFSPSIIIVIAINRNELAILSPTNFYSLDGAMHEQARIFTAYNFGTNQSTSVVGRTYRLDGTYAYVNNGFKIPFPSNNRNVMWFAFE